MLPSRKFSRLVILLMLQIAPFLSTFGQNRTVSVDLNVTAAAINRFLAAQTYPTWQGESPNEGYLYTVTMTKPVVQLETNSAKVLFTINASTNVGNYSFIVQPTITFPNLSITASQTIATLQGFTSLINGRPDIPSWLKPIIIDGYNNLNLIMYPSKLIDYANSAVPEFINITVNDIGLAFSIVPGGIKFTFSVIAAGSPPVFTAQWMKKQATPNTLNLRFGGNVATTVKQVRVYNTVPDEVYNNGSLDITVSKNGYSSQIDISGLAVTTYYVSVLFHSPYGEFARKYYFNFLVQTDGYDKWWDANYASGIN